MLETQKVTFIDTLVALEVPGQNMSEIVNFTSMKAMDVKLQTNELSSQNKLIHLFERHEIFAEETKMHNLRVLTTLTLRPPRFKRYCFKQLGGWS